VILATKVRGRVGQGPNDVGLSRGHIMDGIERSLRRLGTDYVDLYQIHRWDEETPIEETMAALHVVVETGKARYIGASTMRAWQFAKAQQVAAMYGWTSFVSMQNHYNLVYREEEREMLPLCRDQGVGVIPYSPLARGLLARTAPTARTGHDPVADELYGPQDVAVLDAVRAVAGAGGLAPARVALAWLLGRDGVTAPVVGATKQHHVDDAVAALTLDLDDAEVARLEAPYRPHAVR